MSIDKDLIPQFQTEEQEAEYWDTHSPLDLVAEPKVQEIRVRVPKDRPITIRLDSESRVKLNRLAAERGIGPSTFARLILMSVIEQGGKLPKVITFDELKHRLEQSSSRKRGISAAQMKLQKALCQALEGNWQTAISLSSEAAATVSEKYSDDIKGEMQMVWSCIQQVCIKPLLTHAEKLVLNWDYDEATSALEDILNICQAAQLPLDYADLSIRILSITQATCTAAGRWKGDVDAKLNRVMAGVGMLMATVEETIDKKSDGIFYQGRW